MTAEEEGRGSLPDPSERARMTSRAAENSGSESHGRIALASESSCAPSLAQTSMRSSASFGVRPKPMSSQA